MNVKAVLGDPERQLLWLRIEGYFDWISSFNSLEILCATCVVKNIFSECEGIAKQVFSSMFILHVSYKKCTPWF